MLAQDGSVEAGEHITVFLLNCWNVVTYRKSQLTLGVSVFIEEGFNEIDDNMLLCEKIRASVLGRLRKCVSVEGSEHSN